MRRSLNFLPFLLLLLAVILIWVGAAVTAGTPWAPWLDDLHWTVASLGGTWLAWSAARRSEPGAGRVLRRGTALALALYSLGQLVWNLETALGSHPILLVLKSSYLLLGPVMSLTLYYSWRRRHGKQRIPGIHLDTVLMTVGVVVLCSAFYLPLQSGLGNWFVFVVMLLYPVTLFGAFSLGLVLALNDPGRVQLGRLLTLGLLGAMSAAWMFWNLRLLAGASSDGTLLNLVFSLIVLTLGASVATWSWSRRMGGRAWKSGVLILLPLVGPFAGSLGLLVAVADPAIPDFYKPGFAILTGFLWVLALIRQWILFGELREAHAHRQRNAELEDALKQLRRTQDHLVQSEKLSALGQMIAGITHDLNSPLGAIRSSSSLLQTVLQEQSGAFMQFERLDDEHRAVYRALAEALTPETVFLDSRAERGLRREIAERAAARGRELPDELAAVLVESGLVPHEDLIERLFALKDPGAVLLALQNTAVAHRLAAVILQATDRASKVVVSLHTFLRGGGEGERSWVSVAESIQAVLPLFEHRMKQGLRLTTAFAGEAVIWAWADKLAQVWVNLITNAVQAVEGKGAVEIAMWVDNQITVTVTDDGPGVPPEVQDRVFQAFFTTKAAGEGSGLGLEVCRRVVEELGGTISLHSRPGRTVFKVELPVPEEIA